MQSRGFSSSAASTNSALSRLYSGTTPGSPSSYSHTNSSNSRSLTHTDSASTNPSSHRPASIGPAQPTLNGNAASTNLDAAAETIAEEPKTESLDLDWILSQASSLFQLHNIRQTAFCLRQISTQGQRICHNKKSSFDIYCSNRDVFWCAFYRISGTSVL